MLKRLVIILFYGYFLSGYRYRLQFPINSLKLSSTCDINTIELLCNQLGSKSLLQELSRNLFNGSNPSYNWYNNGTVAVRISNTIDVNYDKMVGKSLTNVLDRKRIENDAARFVLDYLFSSKYKSFIVNWISKRSNKDNIPRILRSLDVCTAVANKSLAVLVDAENVPDFKKYFYIDINGDIKFSAPILPQVREAPVLQAPQIGSSTEKSERFVFPVQVDEDIQPYSLYTDSDIFIFAYAHTKSSQALYANRRTFDTRKDAADAMILFDLGSLQHCSSLQHILLITGDGFGSSAAACFDSFTARRPGSITGETTLYRQYDPVSETFITNPNILMKISPVGRYKWMTNGSGRYGQPLFKWSFTCAEGARILGRLSF